MISQNEVKNPTNLDKKRSYKDCTVNPDLPENISTSLWEMLRTHKSVFATSKLDVGKFKALKLFSFKSKSINLYPMKNSAM
jgi:hypothetical protein